MKKYLIKKKVMSERNSPAGKLLLVLCYTDLHPCSALLRLCCFSVWPQRRVVLISSTQDLGCLAESAPGCTGPFAIAWLLLSLGCGWCTQGCGRWKGSTAKGFKGQNAGGSSPSGISAHHVFTSSRARCGHTTMQHAHASPPPAEPLPQNSTMQEQWKYTNVLHNNKLRDWHQQPQCQFDSCMFRQWFCGYQCLIL